LPIITGRTKSVSTRRDRPNRSFVAMIAQAHGVVEDGHGRAAVGVVRCAGVVCGRSELRDNAAAFGIEEEALPHAAGVVGIADEAARVEAEGVR